MLPKKTLIEIISHPVSKWIRHNQTTYITYIKDLKITLEQHQNHFEALSDDIISGSYPPKRYIITIVSAKETIRIIEEKEDMLELLYKKLSK